MPVIKDFRNEKKNSNHDKDKKNAKCLYDLLIHLEDFKPHGTSDSVYHTENWIDLKPLSIWQCMRCSVWYSIIYNLLMSEASFAIYAGCRFQYTLSGVFASSCLNKTYKYLSASTDWDNGWATAPQCTKPNW